MKTGGRTMKVSLQEIIQQLEGASSSLSEQLSLSFSFSLGIVFSLPLLSLSLSLVRSLASPLFFQLLFSV